MNVEVGKTIKESLWLVDPIQNRVTGFSGVSIRDPCHAQDISFGTVSPKSRP
jgi:hypothetical protein